MFPARISSFGNPGAVAEEDVDTSTSPKPEKEPGATRATEIDSTRGDSVEVARRADETLASIFGRAEAAALRPLSESADPSLSELLAATSTESSDAVTVNDSEDSICEIPVPPKPEPLTVYLEDSTDSTSSDGHTDSETTSARRLPPSRGGGDRNRRNEGAHSDAAGAREPEAEEGARQSRPVYLVDTDETSDGEAGTTEYDEGSRGVATESRKNRKKDVPSLSDDDVSGVPDDAIGDAGRGSAGRFAPEHSTAGGKWGKTSSGESSRSSERRGGATTLGRGAVARPEKSLDPDKLIDDVERLLSTMRRAGRERGDTSCGARTGRNISEDGTLILNVAERDGSSHLRDDGERETTAKAPANRKRSTTDGERRSDHGSPAKRAKKSGRRAEVATSGGGGGGGSLEANRKKKDEAGGCAADYFFRPMSGEMKRFYNESWGGENFDVDAIRRRMPRDSRHWAISDEDLLGGQRRGPRYWTRMKCRNCDETGHGVSECTRRKKVPSCHMCGESGHRGPRCPHKRCLGCGKKQKSYVHVCDECRRVRCDGCSFPGHRRDNCPDLWRRYHSTTSITDAIADLSSTDVMKPRHLLDCCNCAKRGHESAFCDSYRWSRHFPTPAYVTDYTAGPAYSGDSMPEDESSPPRADARTETGERDRATDGGSLEGREKEKERDKRRSANPAPDVGDVGDVDETTGRPASEDASRRGGARKGGEPATTNSESREERRMVSLKFESKLLDDRSRRAADFGVCKVPLSHEQYESLAHCDSSRKLFLNLTLQFPVNIQIDDTDTDEIKLLVSSSQDLQYATRLLILGWLKWPVDDRSRFVDLNLPTAKKELAELLSLKLDELNEELGDPFELYEKVQSLKCKLRDMQRQTRAGKKAGLSPKRARVVEELASLQCRLNMILIGQAKGRKGRKSCKYLRTALASMRKAGSPSNVRASTYLRIVHHYNRIFAAYTPDDIQLTLRRYNPCSQKERTSREAIVATAAAIAAANPRSRAFKKMLTDTANDKNHPHFLKSPIEETSNRNLDAIPPSSISPNVSSDRTDRDSRRYFDRCVETQFQSSNLGFNDDRDPDANLHRPKLQTQPVCLPKRNQTNYYGSECDFESSSKYRARGDAASASASAAAAAAVPENLEQWDYIPLDPSDPSDLQKTSDNHYGGSSGESRPRYRNEGTEGDRGNEGDNNVGFGRMFYVDDQPESARNTTGISPRKKNNRRKFNRRQRPDIRGNRRAVREVLEFAKL